MRFNGGAWVGVRVPLRRRHFRYVHSDRLGPIKLSHSCVFRLSALRCSLVLWWIKPRPSAHTHSETYVPPKLDTHQTVLTRGAWGRFLQYCHCCSGTTSSTFEVMHLRNVWRNCDQFRVCSNLSACRCQTWQVVPRYCNTLMKENFSK